MKPHIKLRLKEALRLGHYTLGKGAMRYYDVRAGVVCYCPLGVLCELSGLGHWVSPLYVGSDDAYAIEGESATEKNSAFPPNTVLEWAGLELEDAEELVGQVDSRELTHDDVARQFDQLIS